MFVAEKFISSLIKIWQTSGFKIELKVSMKIIHTVEKRKIAN
jgi:hypothetical protein